MAERELIAATLVAGILNGKDIPLDESGAAIVAEFHRKMVAAMVKSDAAIVSAQARRSY